MKTSKIKYYRFWLSLLFLLIQSTIYSQILKREYWDYYKTKLKAEYQVNSAGYGNGYYKGYDENGVLLVEQHYINGIETGTWKEYSTSTGTLKLSSLKTYKDGVLNGPYEGYAGTGILLESGNMVDGKEDGKWKMNGYVENTWHKSLKDSYYDDDGCSYPYLKYTILYDHGTIVSYAGGLCYLNLNILPSPVLNPPYLSTNVPDKPDGVYKEYYYPCKKLFAEYIVSGGKIISEHKYYPGGKTLSTATYSYKNDKDEILTIDEVLTYSSYYPNGQLYYIYDNTVDPFNFEAYEEDGKPTYTYQKLLEKRKNEKEEELRSKYLIVVDKGDSCLSIKNFDCATNYYNDVAKDLQIGGPMVKARLTLAAELNNAVNYENNSDIQRAYYSYMAAKNITKDDKLQKIIQDMGYKTISEYDLLVEKGKKLKAQTWIVVQKLNEYVNLYAPTSSTTVVYGIPITKSTFPKGKIIYNKSLVIIDEQKLNYSEGVNDLIKFIDDKNSPLPKLTVIEDRYNAGEILLFNLEQMIKLAQGDTKDLNKSLKKAKDNTAIKSVLGLQ